MERAAKGKGMGTLAVLAFGEPKKGAPPSDHEEPDEDDEMHMSGHEAAFNSYANAVGIPEDKRPAAMAALKQFVQSCMGEYGPEKE